MKKIKIFRRRATVLGLTAIFTSATALAVTGVPPADDPSALSGPVISEELSNDLANQIPAMEGALEIQNHEFADVGLDNGLLTGTQDEGDGGKYDGERCSGRNRRIY